MSMFTKSSSIEAKLDNPKNKWCVAKYAPVKYNPKGYSETKALTQQRQQKHAEKVESKNKESAELAAVANKRDAACTQIRAMRAKKAMEQKKRSEAARKHYQERQQKRLDKSCLTSPTLDANLNQRVHMYAKYHKCPHGLANNRIQKDDDKYVIDCDHDKCEKSIARAVQCGSCGTYMTTKYTNRECHCSFYSCSRCKRAQYTYEFQDHNLRMCYDKHNTQRTQVRLTLGKTIVQPSFDSVLPAKPSKEQKESRERFLSSVSKPAATSFADSVTRLPAPKPVEKSTPIPKPKPPKRSMLFSKVPERENRFVPVKDLIETKPQGAALSHATHPFVAAGQAIKDKYKELRDRALAKIAEIEARIYNNVIEHAFKKLLQEIFESFRYLIGLVYDYCYVLNPILLYRLWMSRHSPASFLLYLGEALMHLKEYEKQNRENALQALSLGLKDFKAFYSEGGQGVLRTILKYKLKSAKNPSIGDLAKIIRGCGLTAVFRNEHKPNEPKVSFDNDDGVNIDTNPQNGTSQLLEAIGNILSVFPKSLGRGITFLRSFFKENMPILMGVKALGDIQKLASRLVESGMKILYGECSNHKEWLEMQLCNDDNPIHAVTVTYMTYMGISSGFNTTATREGTDMSAMRQRFYTELSVAEAYVKEKKKLGMVWFQYKRTLTDTFNVPPPPVTRKHEPLCVVLSGGAGLGKSTLWKILLSRELCPNEKENVSQKMEDMTHTWNSATEYQPGMASKRIVVFDDFMQNIAEVNEALQVIALCTTAPYPVTVAPIAGPEIKGMFCSPDAVVLCTNTTVERAGSQLADHTALKRRYDIDFEISERYNPKEPTKHIFTIKSCPMFSKLIGKTVDLETARNITSVLYRKKRDEYRETAEMVEDLLSSELDTVINMGQKELPKQQFAWMRDDDFSAAWDKYVVNTKQEALGLPAELLATLYSNCLMGVVVGAPLAVAASFATFIRTLTESIYGATRNYLAKEVGHYHYLKNIFASFVKCTLATIASSLALFGAFKLLTREQESGVSRTAKSRGAQVKTFEEAGTSEGQQNMLIQSTGSMLVLDSGKTTNCVFVGGHYVLVPYHLFTDFKGNLIENGQKIEITKVSWKTLIKCFLFDRKAVVRLTGNIDEALSRRGDVLPKDAYREDVCLYRLPTSMFSAEKNITKHFWDGTYNTTNFPVRKIDYIPYNLDRTYNGQIILNDGTVKKDSISTPRFEGELQKYHVLAEATYAGRDASCGSLVIRPDVQETPILGIHTAANSRGSYFHYVTRQSLDSAMSRNVVRDVETKFTYCEPQAAVAELLPKQSILQIVGTIEKPLFQPTKTDLQPSLLYELMGPAKTAPAPLSHRDPRVKEEYRTFPTFWQQMFKGYSRSFEPSFEPSEVNSAYLSMLDDFKRIKSQSMVPTKKLDLMESLNGLSHIPQNTRMPMNTSCGYPYVQEGLKKQDLFDEREGRLYPSARIIADYEHAIEQLEQGTVPYLPYVLSLKDERLKHEKITTPRTRIFTCGNVVGYLVCRRYFYSALMQYYHAEMRDSFCCPSLDRASFDWHYLSKHMLEVGDKGFDFDFSHYDRSLQHQLLYFATKLLLAGQSLSPQEEAAVIEMVCTSFIIWGSTVFRGELLPSGILITFIINCIVNELMHRMAWRNIMARERPTLLPMRYYREYTRGTRGGDDTFSTVDERVLPYYNGKTVAEYLRSRNMKVTAADKSYEIPEFTNYFDLSFLKNVTRYERGVFLPVSESASLYESTYWVRLSQENNDIVKATQDNATCSMRSLYFHGEEVFEDFRNKALAREPRLVLPTYEELSVIWNNYHCFPGSHTDFASREIQEDPFTLASTEKPRVPATERAKYNMSPIEMIETFDQSGQTGLEMKALDKQELGTAGIKTASTHEEIDKVEDETIDNKALGTPGKKSTEAVGATVEDGPSTKAKPVKTGNQLVQSENVRSEVYMNDVNWDLKKLVQKFTYVGDFTWSTANVVGNTLMKLEAPKDFLVTPAQKEPFDVTRFWKGTILVKVVIKSSPFYAGGLVIGFSPFQKAPSIPALVNMGALIHKLSQEEGLEFVIPFRWPVGFIDAQREFLGSFVIMVNSALKTGPANPNTINGAVYVSLVDSEFKLPEVVPSQNYRSYKFDNSVIDTVPQSGVSVKSVLCDINDLPSKMPLVKMCAGEGTVGTPPVPHFQDAPSDLMQLLKRWEMVSRLSVGIAAGKAKELKFPLNDIFVAAMRGFDRYFAMYRGSVNLRFSLEAAGTEVYGKISFNPYSRHLNGQQPSNCGLQTFDSSSMGMVTVPWTQPYFVLTTEIAGSINPQIFVRDVVDVIIFNNAAENKTVVLNIDVSVGDDFHMGVYLGTPLDKDFPTMYKRQKLLPADPVDVDTEYDGEYPVTEPQSGMLQFVGRAIENTLPLVEQISELGLELDAHMITEQNHLVQQRRRPFSIASDLPVLTERFTTVNHNGMSLPDSQCFGSEVSETDINNLLQNTKSIIGRFSWKAADEAGALLATYDNSPIVPGTNGAHGIHNELSAMFNFWTGGRIIIFDVHSTQMHRGQLLMSYSTNTTNIAYKDATQTYFTTLDLSEGRATVALQLPYLSPIPQRRTTYIGEEFAETETTVGTLRVFVQNPLRSTATVSPDVEVVVYESCASDYQLNVYGGTPFVGRPTTPPTITRPSSVPQHQRRPLIKSTLPKIIRSGYDNA